jgi:lysophospholipase L1-like esterase
VTFLGDSITQGLGTAPFAYEFWVARLANALPEGVFVRNLGLGFARAEDAARDGVWLEKAKTAKRVVLCLGTNDLLQRSRRGDANLASLVFEDVRKTALLLKAAGVRVFLLSVPPFDWQGDVKEAWQNVNLRLQNEVAPLLDGFFVTARVWGKAPPIDNEAAYTDERSGSHPNGEGGRAMAEALLPHLVNFLQLQA